jgi:hypothetical protein
MILTNRTIQQQLSLKGIHVPTHIIHVLRALEGNNILPVLDLSRCLDVKEEQKLFDAILNCLQTNPWLHLNLEDTPLSKSGRKFSIIQQKLDQNTLFFEKLESRVGPIQWQEIVPLWVSKSRQLKLAPTSAHV